MFEPTSLTRLASPLGELVLTASGTSFDLPLEAAGSAFERRVWEALRKIPYGTTTSYGELARRLGDVKATRAGGGLDRKRWLLEHEGTLLMKLGS